MNIMDKTDEEIIEIANPLWDDLIKYSNNRNYGKFIKDFAYSLRLGANEMEMGRQFAKSDLAKNLSKEYDFLGTIRRGEHVTVLYRQKRKDVDGDWLGRLVLGDEEGQVRIFGATIF